MECTYKEQIQKLYDDFVKQDEQVDEALNERLKAILLSEDEDVDVKAYMQVMYMEGKQYHAHSNTNAARYCALRLLQIEECMHKKRKVPQFLEMCEYEVPSTMQVFIDEYTSFLDDIYSYITKRILLITMILMVVIGFVFYFVFHISIAFSILNAVVIATINFVVQKRRLPEMFQTNQLDASRKFVDADVLEFDRPIRYS